MPSGSVHRLLFVAPFAPRLDGMQLLSRLAERAESIAVIMVTAQGTIESAVQAMQIGAFVHAGDEDESRTEPFTLPGDEPPILLGHNQGPNAVELLLAALDGNTHVGAPLVGS